MIEQSHDPILIPFVSVITNFMRHTDLTTKIHHTEVADIVICEIFLSTESNMFVISILSWC